jgi:hypothetical protein
MKTKYFSMWQKATDKDGQDHYVTVVGQLVQTREREMVQEVVPVEINDNTFVDGVLTYPSKKLLKKTLTLGVSICHPKDEFDKEVGFKIAKARILKGNTIGSLQTSGITMLTEDAIMAEIYTKLTYISDNIDKYITSEN